MGVGGKDTPAFRDALRARLDDGTFGDAVTKLLAACKAGNGADSDGDDSRFCQLADVRSLSALPPWT
jgi:hypothetical protein